MSESVSQWVTRSPIELFCTAKKDNNELVFELTFNRAVISLFGSGVQTVLQPKLQHFSAAAQTSKVNYGLATCFCCNQRIYWHHRDKTSRACQVKICDWRACIFIRTNAPWQAQLKIPFFSYFSWLNQIRAAFKAHHIIIWWTLPNMSPGHQSA